MFGIIDKNKKFILLDDNRESLRTTALMLAKEVEVVVPDYNEDNKQISEHTERHHEPMFAKKTIDEEIKEYSENDIETTQNGDKYLKR